MASCPTGKATMRLFQHLGPIQKFPYHYPSSPVRQLASLLHDVFGSSTIMTERLIIIPSLKHLRNSFVATLNEFRQWAGLLQWISSNPGGGYTKRFTRIKLLYGSADDSEVQWKIVSYLSYSPGQFAATHLERPSRTVWRKDNSEQLRLITNCDLALYDLESWKNLLGISVQISLFGDGGCNWGEAGTGCSTPHTIAQNLHHDTGSSSLFDPPILDPKQLSNYASGDITGSGIDPHLAAVAQALPLHRYDCWEANTPNFPPFIAKTLEITMPPSSFLKNNILSPAHSAPWSPWDTSKPLSYTYIHFTRHDLSEPLKLSRLDSTIDREREMEQFSDDIFIDLTLGAQAGVSPSLPDLSMDVLIYSVRSLARSVRSTVTLLTPEDVGAMLHDAAYEASSLRLWQGFPGQRHIIAAGSSSRFEGSSILPRYVHAMMPKIDGVLQVFDSEPVTERWMSHSIWMPIRWTTTSRQCVTE
ncbi:hypothetical protein DPV78_012303 [Talaromyces pinophilus]|nr:hypothetical protein DPV78_012303 [Talaromyces pinophilus]